MIYAPCAEVLHHKGGDVLGLVLILLELDVFLELWGVAGEEITVSDLR